MSSPETVFNSAVKFWWSAKEAAAAKNQKIQGGARDENLSGQNMDGFRDVIREHLLRWGVEKDDIFSGSGLSARQAAILPSFYRPTKNWDVIVCKNSFSKKLEKPAHGQTRLVLAIEFKSQHRSIGNNQNNRMEESLGAAEDFWAAYGNKSFIHLTPRPWLGYLFMGVHKPDHDSSTVKIQQPHFLVDEAFAGKHREDRLTKTTFDGPSYAYRYKVFLERMIAKQKYDSGCFITTHQEIKDKNPNYDILFPEFSGQQFLDHLERHIRGYYQD